MNNKGCQLSIKARMIWAIACALICMLDQIVAQDTKAQPENNSKPLYMRFKTIDDTVQTFKSDRSVIIADIKELTRRSTHIVVGWVVNNRSRLSENSDNAYISHMIQVQTVIKGDIKNGSTIELRSRGGTWVRPDGKRIDRLASDARPLRNKVSYFIFMKKEYPAQKGFIPALGSQSLYQIESDTNSILPCDLVKEDPVVQKYENISIQEFMDELISAVASESLRGQYRQ
jgi:hypothetical protein